MVPWAKFPTSSGIHYSEGDETKTGNIHSVFIFPKNIFNINNKEYEGGILVKGRMNLTINPSEIFSSRPCLITSPPKASPP